MVKAIATARGSRLVEFGSSYDWQEFTLELGEPLDSTATTARTASTGATATTNSPAAPAATP